MKISFVATLMLGVSAWYPSSVQVSDIEASLDAYRLAADLGDKHTAFAHAEMAYDKARRLAKNDEGLLFEATYAYGLAAVAVHEPNARAALLEAVDYLETKFGPQSETLLEPLILAAEDALWRSRPEDAYALFKRTLDLEAAFPHSQPLMRARGHAGLARQYLDVRDLTRAKPAAERALKALQEVSVGSNPIAEAGVRKKVGDVYLAAGNLEQAQDLFEEAVDIAKTSPKLFEERTVRSLLKRLVKVHDLQGNHDKVRSYCHTIATWGFKVGGGGILYDPSGRLWPGSNEKRGVIHARFGVNTDCRLENIEVVATEKISEDEAYKILEALVYSPGFKGQVEPYDDFRVSMFVKIE